MQALQTHGPAPALAAYPVLTAYPVPILAQGDLQATGAVASLMVPEGLDQGRFPGRCGGPLDPLLARLPGIVAAGRHV